MRRFFLAPALAVMLMLAACATNAPKYQAVDLNRDLSPATLARYKAAAAQAGKAAMEHSGDCCHTVLEKTDGRLLGALFYWQGGSVEAMTMDGTPVYMVSETLGVGPLSFLYIERRTSTYDANGRRISGMSGASVMYGCVAMTHGMETRVNGDQWHNHWMGHFVHHLIGVSKMNEKTSFALFSMPNVIMIGD